MIELGINFTPDLASMPSYTNYRSRIAGEILHGTCENQGLRQWRKGAWQLLTLRADCRREHSFEISGPLLLRGLQRNYHIASCLL